MTTNSEPTPQLHIEQDFIDELARTPTGIRLFETLLDRRPSECFLTDLSSLSDFFPTGLPDRSVIDKLSYKELVAHWDRVILDKVHAEFGLRLDSTTTPLIQVIPLLQSVARPRHLH